MPANLIDKVRAALKRPSSTAADLAAAVADARQADADARAAVEKAQAAVAAGFMDSGERRARDRATLEAAREAAEDAALLLAEAERRHGEAIAAEAEAARRAMYAAAKSKGNAVGSSLVQRYCEAAAALVALLHDLAEANVAIDAANADRPAGAPELPHPETLVRSTPGLPWLPDEVETVERWAFSDGTPVADVHLGSVIDYGGGRGSYKTTRVEGIDDVEVGQPVERRRFQKVTSYQPTAGTYLTELARSIRLPHLYADQNIIGSDFTPNTWTPSGDLVRDAEQRLTFMAKLAPSETDRPKRVELRPLWAPAEVAKAAEPVIDYHDRVARPAPGSRFSASPFQPAGARGRSGGRR